ncbi:MAG TPA: hypothetical protein VGE52_05950, partial [Pirellulales bacterium]
FVAMDFPAVARNVLGTFFSAEQQAGLGAMFNLAELPPSYLGLTAAVEKDGARLKAFLPVAQVGGVLAMLPK